MEIGARVMLEALAADGFVSVGLIASNDAIAGEAIRRYNDPMSDPKPIYEIIALRDNRERIIE